MSLSPGSRLGVYEIVSLIGHGGMGEVYRARDTRLARDVALKMLRTGDATDPAWRARLEREARVLASLNHPNIAAIYGFEENAATQSGGAATAAIVMELVEGETLAARLKRGPLPLDEALNAAGQIADALEAAHRRGIVHRDLKPANVTITPSGTVKVLDFGLAKLVANPAQPDATISAITAPGVVFGTPAYVAPEQAKGGPVDARVDVWAFGVVLYEMVTGDRAFPGDSVQETLAAVLTAEPRWEVLPPSVKPLLRACLERDPGKRLRDIGDYRFLLGPANVPQERSRPSVLRSASVGIAALAAVLLAFFAGKSLSRDEGLRDSAVPIRLSTMLPDGVSVTRGPGYTSSVAVAPDGRTVVIAASDRDGQRLYRRPLDRLEPTPLAGTERGTSPFFSWDGKWIGFFADGRLKRVPVDGGASVDIAEAPGFSSGASWGPDGRIVFAYGADSRLQVVPAEGGSVEPLTATPGRQPEVLPDGQTVLFEFSGHIHAYTRQTGAIKKLLPGTAPRYANGHVVFSRGRTLLAAPFNTEDASMGAAIPLLEGVAVELPGSGGGRHYAMSRSGALVYVPAADAYELVVISADGVERVVGQPQRSLENPRISPKGRYVVVASRRRDDEPTDLWLHDLQAETATRLTSGGARAPIWSHDGTRIIYSHLGERQGIYSARVDGGGNPVQILAVTSFHWLVGWGPDRATLLYGQMMEGGSAIMAHSSAQSRTVVGPASTWGGRISRDGKWLAYYLLNSGVFEVYVTRFPEGDAPWLITEGTDPSWAPDGNEIYYRNGPRLVAARLDKTAGVKVLTRRVVIEPFLPPLYDDYDIHPDGRTLVVVRPVNRTQGREVSIVLNWFDEFHRSGR